MESAHPFQIKVFWNTRQVEKKSTFIYRLVELQSIFATMRLEILVSRLTASGVQFFTEKCSQKPDVKYTHERKAPW